MDIQAKLKEIKENKGWYSFITRSGAFFSILFATYLAIFLWLRHTTFFVNNLRLTDDFYIPFLSGLSKMDFLNAILFTIIAFILWNRKELKNIFVTQRKKKETILYSILTAIFFIAHYALKYIIVNQNLGANITLVFVKYALLIGFVIMLAISTYTKEFLTKFIIKYRKSIGVSFIVLIVYFFLIKLFQTIWYSLSSMIAQVIRFLLSLTFNYVIFSPGNLTTGPKLGIPGFVVSISSACSGTDSLLLFLSLFSILLLLDWKKMHLKRMAILFIIGVIGTVAYNILRIYALLLVGIFIDPVFAIDAFHTNAGWILFLLFFMIFWHFGSKWAYKKVAKEQKGMKKIKKSKKAAKKKV